MIPAAKILTDVGNKSHIIMLLPDFAGVCIFAMELIERESVQHSINESVWILLETMNQVQTSFEKIAITGKRGFMWE